MVYVTQGSAQCLLLLTCMLFVGLQLMTEQLCQMSGLEWSDGFDGSVWLWPATEGTCGVL